MSLLRLMSQVMLTNPIELAVHKHLNSITTKDSILSKKVIKNIVKDIETALNKQFVEKRTGSASRAGNT